MANALFWFFPASWLSLREYSQAREEACDAEALRVTRGQPDTYAQQLRLGILEGEIGRQVQETIVQTLETAVANGTAKPATP